MRKVSLIGVSVSQIFIGNAIIIAALFEAKRSSPSQIIQHRYFTIPIINLNYFSMKKLMIAFLFCFSIYSLSAQIPGKLHIETIARHKNGELRPNNSFGIVASIIKDSLNGEVVYAEKLTSSTDQDAFMSFEVGWGTVLIGDNNKNLSTINWGESTHFVKMEAISQSTPKDTTIRIFNLLSVPYAFHARSASGGLSLSTSNSGDTLFLSGGNWLLVPGSSGANSSKSE